LRIPFDRRIAEALAQGKTLVESFPEFLPRFEGLYHQILDIVDKRTNGTPAIQPELST